MGKCECRICLGFRRMERIIEGRNVDGLIKLVREYKQHIDYVEEDNNYYAVVMDGSWPSSLSQLTHSLGLAIEHKKDLPPEIAEKYHNLIKAIGELKA